MRSVDECCDLCLCSGDTPMKLKVQSSKFKRSSRNQVPKIKQQASYAITSFLLICLSSVGFSAEPSVRIPKDLSLRNEVQHAIDKGTAWLLASQNTNGWWSTADAPAVTALALSALEG